jgi:hypothetical protein
VDVGNLQHHRDFRLESHPVVPHPGALAGKDGGDYGQVYISMLCTVSGDQVLCGIRDDPSDSSFTDISSLGINEFISHADSVTVKLRATGGLHRAEGILYDIT